MTKKQAIHILANFLQDHIIAGDFQNDETYTEEIEALKKLGYIVNN